MSKNKLALIGGVSSLSVACILTMTAPSQAMAQASQAAQSPPIVTAAENVATVEEVTITGSRIRVNGNELPTPVTVIGADQLSSTTPTSIPDALNKLPAFNGNNTPNNASRSNGLGARAPGNFLDLRGLGPIRNLILHDGHRVLGTFFDGTVDADMLPQALIQRVEVVTGGASAVYGSDAVSGVVNFITDNRFNGLKGSVQTGISNYSDSNSYRASVAGGTQLGERGHLIASAEFMQRDGISDMCTRKYGCEGISVIGSGTAASPSRLASDVRYNTMTWGGLPVSGPFVGRRFDREGLLVPYVKGLPTDSASIMIGGDGGRQHNEQLTPDLRTKQGYIRYDHEFSDSLRGYTSLRMGSKSTFAANSHISNTATNFPITIYTGNAFLRPEQQAELTATNTSSFQMGRESQEFSGPADPKYVMALGMDTQSGAFTVGLSGDAFGDFAWDAYYEKSDTRTKFLTVNNVNAEKFYAAIDAVRDSSGNVVCRSSIVAPTAFPGCRPLNPFGEYKMAEDAMNYVTEDTWWTAFNKMDDVGANITGTLFDGWAGPIKLAAGAEFRTASLLVTTSVPDPSFHPANLRAGANGSTFAPSNLMYIKEVQGPANGSEDVSEANVELNVPLLKDVPLAETLTFNGGYRYTHYAVEGNGTSADFNANTWKVGLEWRPFSDLRLRATRSRDIRAPTLWDLYQVQSRSSGAFNDVLTGQAGSVNTVRGGNSELLPEEADNTTAGLVYTPSFIPRFSISVDYYRVEIANAIGAVNGGSNTVQQLCLASDGSSPYCALIKRPINYNNKTPANFPTLIYSLNQNIAYRAVEGVDVEVNYSTDLDDWSPLRGTLGARLLYTHQPVNESQALQGAVITNEAGTPSQPEDKINFNLDYKLDRLSLSVTQRWLSSQHRASDPTQIFLDPDLKAYVQTDIGAQYQIRDYLTGFLNMSNIFEAESDLVGGGGSIPGQFYPTPQYADIIGRYYTLGLRFRF